MHSYFTSKWSSLLILIKKYIYLLSQKIKKKHYHFKRSWTPFKKQNFQLAEVNKKDIPYKFDWHSLGYNSVYLDIGCGNGEFTTKLSEYFSKNLVIGVELHRKYMQKGVNRALDLHLPNAKFVHDRVENFLKYLVADKSLQAVFINFPDPWLKKKHHKRRLFDQEFWKLLEQKISPAGHIYFMSDNQEIFEYAFSRGSLVFPLVKKDPPIWYPQSKYYRKWVKQGRTIYFFTGATIK